MVRAQRVGRAAAVIGWCGFALCGLEGCGATDDARDGPSATVTSDGSVVSADGDAGESDTDGGSSGTSDGSADPSTADDGSDDAPAGTETGEPPAACEGPSVFTAGVQTGITVDVDGVARSYDLFVPTTYSATTDAPLVVNFHGLLGSPSQQSDFSQFNATAQERGMLVAYPAGIGASFNGGVCCGDASAGNVDDVGFARALVQDVASKMCVDPKRVYATGMSNGGHMAHRLACEAADVFAATASVAGVLSLAAACTPSRPISIVQFHGTADSIVSYNGIPAVPPMMEAWAARNGCSPASETTFDSGDMFCETWPGCDAGVEVSLCTIDGGGHCWPGNASCLFGNSSTQLHASDEIADMFESQPLP